MQPPLIRVGLLILLFAHPAFGSTLESIRWDDNGDGEIVVIAVLGERPYIEHFALSSPSRYVIDIAVSRVDSTFEVPASRNSSLVQSIRVGKHPDPKTRIVLDLADSASVTDLSTTDANEGQATLISVSIADIQAARARSQAGPETPDTIETAALKRTDDDGKPDDGGQKTLVFGKRDSSSGTPAQAGSIVFGAQRSTTNPATPDSDERHSSTSTSPGRWNFAVDRALLESGWIDSELGDGANLHLQTIVSVQGSVSEQLEVRLAGRVDGQYQFNDLPELERTRFDYDESWLRYRSNQWQFTAGAQRIIWGRTDEFSPTDRLSTRDFTRLLFDDLQDRRRANPALRLEWLGMNQSLDAVILPVFREAEWPSAHSVWFPYDAQTGEIAGLPINDFAKSLLRGATVNNEIDGEAGYGLRYSRVGSSFDYAITAQRVHNPEPYFTVGRPPTPVSPAILETIYPRTWVVGADAGMAISAWTFRAEIAWLSDAAYTNAATFQVLTTDRLNWVVGAEIFPGDGDLRLTAQLSGNHILNAENALDWEDVISVIGDVETPFDAGGLSWNARMRYSIRLDESAYYLHPEVAITSWEPSELYVGLHLLGGDEGTQQGYYSQRDALVFGWRAKF